MQTRANESVYWPGLNASIRNTRQSCRVCTQLAPSQPKEPLLLTDVPQWPFQHICMDMFEHSGHNYLAVVDRYSGWLIMYHMRPGEATSNKLINITRNLFITYGAPDELSSDGGTIFTSHAFQSFLTDWGVKHRLSSAAYPQSNGRAELAVKSAKRMIYDNISQNGSLDNDRVARAVLQYRTTSGVRS